MAEQIPPSATRIIQRPGEGRTLLVRRSRIQVVSGPDLGLAAELEASPLLVGSGAKCGLRLTDEAVSAEHFSLMPSERGFALRDLGSTNGTYVAGMRVERGFLGDAATIVVGGTSLRFDVGADEVSLSLSSKTRFGPLLGHSDAMRSVFAILERVANSDAVVLLEGESGTGKDVAARALHERSDRAGGLLVAVDCGAIPAELIESELFGHRKGAFTGADQERIGPFEEAAGGTVFLDEIGELPLRLQPKLLRTLESRTVRRVGENHARPFDARVVAATNRDLKREVEAGRFRADLYFRLSVIRVQLPPLRQRPEEIPRLAAAFLGEFGRDPTENLPGPLMAALQGHSWPGNVRELRNVVQRLALLPDMSPEYYLGHDAGAPVAAVAAGAPDTSAELALPFHQGKTQCVEDFERRYLRQMQRLHRGNVSEMARQSGLSRQAFYRLLNRYGMTPPADVEPTQGEGG